MGITKKQAEVIKCVENENPKILICAGAKRAGKTWILMYCFLNHVAKYQGKGLNFILGGTNQASLRRNVLNDLELILGREIKLAKDNHFKLFGNKIYCFHGQNSDAYKQLRGFTSAGAFLNEATTLHDSFIKEAISRCSYDGARIYMDTNPENPTHTVKTDYIDKNGQKLKNGQVNIRAFNFTLFDNVFLNDEYIESIIASTPSGMFTQRDIYGTWVASEGVVYSDFDKDIHYIKSKDLKKYTFKKYLCGVDFGWEHHGTISVIGKTIDDEYILIKEYAYQHKDIEFWCKIAKNIIKQYGNINFYCDCARPDYINKMQSKGIRAINADKNVLEGISSVATLIKTRKFLVVEEGVNLFKTEIYNYIWQKGKDEPVKTNDDVLDGVRYAIYSDLKRTVKAMDRSRYGI